MRLSALSPNLVPALAPEFDPHIVLEPPGSASHARRARASIAFEALLAAGFEQNPVSLAIADLTQPDCPLTHVNAAFTHLTGYRAKECIGRNCRFLQGPRTDPEAVAMIADAVHARHPAYVELLNYRKDGTPFWNGLRVSPVLDAEGRAIAVVAVQQDVTAQRAAHTAELDAAFHAREVTHRVKNAFQVIESMVKLSGRGSRMPHLVDKIATRVRAIATAHATSLAQPHAASVPVDPVVRDVLDPYQEPSAEAGRASRIAIEGPLVHVFPGTVSVLAVVLNELAANAVRHGALSRPFGRVDVSWESGFADLDETTEVAFTWIETRGPSTAPPLKQGEGSATVDRLLYAAGGRIERVWDPRGLRAKLTLPRER